MKEDRIRLSHFEQTLKKIGSIENAVNNPHYDLSKGQAWSVNIRVDNSVAPAMFKPDPQLEGGWIANELTFRAMKKDIFALDEGFEDLAVPYQCVFCNNNLDKQFWIFCPYCGNNFKD